MIKERKAAVALYKQGFSTRDVGEMIGKSHEWVRQAVMEVDVDNSIDIS